MKTCQVSIKQNTQIKGKKGTKWKDSSPGKKKEPPMRVDRKGNMNK